MENLTRRFSHTEIGPINYVFDRGIAYQRDLDDVCQYDDEYVSRCVAYRSNPERLEAVNAARIEFVRKHYGDGMLLDYGVGAGDFLLRRANTMGFDIVKSTRESLKKSRMYSEDIGSFDAISCWDVLEHMKSPELFLRNVKDGARLFVSIPVIADLNSLEKWPHYKPREHLWYFTERGFIFFMEMHGFKLEESCRVEEECGRRDILTTCFSKSLPGYADMIGFYSEMHQRRYGVSADDHRDQIAEHVKHLCPSSILDYGCGQAGFAKWFWADGKRKVSQFDPAIPAFKEMPSGYYDLVLCCDVMEHIEMRFVDRVFEEIKAKLARGGDVIFTISTKPARAKLPDGRNAHVTLLSPEEWRAWIENVFGEAYFEPTVHPMTVLVRTFKKA